MEPEPTRGASVPDRDLARRNRSSMARAYRLVLGPAGRVVDLGGLQATVLDRFPEAALSNSVHPRHPAAVSAEALSALEEEYAASGVRSWSVWTRPGDADGLAPMLVERGHVLAEQPLVMAGALADMDLEPRAELDVENDAPWTAVGRVVDEAFGFDAAYFADIMAAQEPVPTGPRRWTVRSGGELAGCVVAVPDGDEVNVAFVAVLPSAQGRGLGTHLLRHALRECRSGGATTASLESTGAGEDVYARIGFRSLGRLGNFQRDLAAAR